MKTTLLRGLTVGAVTGVTLGLAGAGVAHAVVPVTTEPYTVAAISAASVEFDLDASLDLADRLTADAAASGAELVTFGELWLPGFPRQINSDPSWAAANFPDYAANALTVGDANWERLLDIADEHDVYLSMGFAEREGDHLYMGQALIGPDGAVLETRRKIRPSGSERNFFSDDVMDGNLEVTETALGRIGMLECWEHLHPQMTYPMHAKGENVHVLAWPYNPTDNTGVSFWEDGRVAESAARMYAMTGGTWVVSPAAGWAFVMNPFGQMIAQSKPGDDFVTAKIDPRGFGGSDVYNPRGEHSWGVWEMIGDTYPDSAKVPDPEHGTRNVVSLAGLGVGGAGSTPTPTPTPTPTSDPTASPTPSVAPAVALPGGDAGNGGLASTGVQVTPWGVAAFGSIVIGAALVWMARRSRARGMLSVVAPARK